jgi:heptosyltransferase-2
LGINAGATYGSAKRWYPEKFAEVIKVLSKKYSVILFGGAGEIEINSDIEQMADIKLQNLAGKTSIQELAENIAGLSLFITNDSGPMHIAGAFKIPTVAIFGSTNHIETNQWKNSRQEIVRKNIECSPCMKRECPLKHHDCMKNISASDVLNAVEKLFEDKR